jgi:ferritin-like protein
MTRASFLLRGALAAAAAYGTSAVAPYVSRAIAQAGSNDIEILNFALALEYLQSELYNVEATSIGLGAKAREYSVAFGAQERQHVAALETTIAQLGGTPLAKPAFVFGTTDERTFLALASKLENTAVGAYNGAGPSISDKTVLAAVGGIVQVEARHAAAINLLIGRSPTPTAGFDRPLSTRQALAVAGPLIS